MLLFPGSIFVCDTLKETSNISDAQHLDTSNFTLEAHAWTSAMI